MPRVEFSASMMCANYANLQREVTELEAAGIDSFHIDLMDGRFVDNFGMGYQDMTFIRSATAKPMEAHLMLEDPHTYLDIIAPMNFSTVYIHPEADKNPAGALEKLEKMGITPGISLNPGTAIEQVAELLHPARKVMVMCVNPGHAGRTVLPYVDLKIERLLDMKEKYDFEIILDGGCTPERIRKFSAMGVDAFVLGTATLFGKDRRYSEILPRLRDSIENPVLA
ncbi:MAG: ribulose-phosphate 3-epimerase [Bacteroidales bacterium]